MEDKTTELRIYSQNIFTLNEGSKVDVRQDAFFYMNQGPFLFSAVAFEPAVVRLDFREEEGRKGAT